MVRRGRPFEDVEATGLRRHRGIIVVVCGTLAVIVSVVLAVLDTADHLVGPPASASYTLVAAPDEQTAPQMTDLHLLVTSLDETNGLLTIRVDGYQQCRPTCQADERLVLVALRTDQVRGRHLPPSAVVPLPSVSGPVVQTVQLPVRIQAMRFPFDPFDLLLGLALTQSKEDSPTEHRTEAEAKARMHVTLQSELPQMSMGTPVHQDERSLGTDEGPYDYFVVDSLHFSRWRAGQSLTVLLVLLIAAAAAYAVFLRPLHDLILSAGGLVIGVWGIRSILVPSNIAGRTGVDVALALVIIFLLGAMSIRVALLVIAGQGKLRDDDADSQSRRKAREPEDAATPEETSPPDKPPAPEEPPPAERSPRARA